MDSSPGLRHRRSFAKHTRRELSSDSSEDLISGSSVVSEVTEGGDRNINKADDYLLFKTNPEKDTVQLDPDGTESGLSGLVDGLNKENLEDCFSTSSNRDIVSDSGEEQSSTGRESGEDRPDLLFTLVELVVKAIDPILSMRRGRDYLLGKIIKIRNFLLEAIAPSVSEWLKENHSCFEVAVRCAWGFFWAAYVGSILVGLLVSAFVGSGLIIRCLVEEPFHQEHSLNLDFTENKPVAIVPITASRYDVDNGESILMESQVVARVIPPNRKLQATITLTLPESEYNRKLGMFQVRVEFLCANGKTLASLRQPCILHFKSGPIRLLQTFIKAVPLVTGYSSESQKLKLMFQGFTEGDVPCAYLKVIIEQRAEFRPAGGIPQVYDVALLLESELPLLKSIVWSWRKTLFVWLSMVLFMIELLCALVCCHKVVMPSLRLDNNSAARNNATQADQ
ncbi:hypothetical protein V2J09_017718 [Rumex salicifolius]